LKSKGIFGVTLLTFLQANKTFSEIGGIFLNEINHLQYHHVVIKLYVIANFMLSRAQCRAARGLLDISQSELAKESHIALRTILDFERGSRKPLRQTLLVIKYAFEEQGVEFIDQEGVRFKRSQP
jgi:DNA-binding XRE family transcriptional regulator